MSDLIAWKNTVSPKPLIIRGARQVGKTWLMKEFGKTEYAQTAYVNFEKSKHLKGLFTDDFDVKRIIIALQAETGMTINPENTLLIFDEIQEVPEAITALKYFNEDAPGYQIVAAGSLLGIALHSDFSFPVGKVTFLDLYPLSFTEYLDAIGESSLIEILKTSDWKLITAYRSKFVDRLKQYYFVGGMPEAVIKFSETSDFNIIRAIQKQIIQGYEYDFSKHVPAETIPRIRMVWDSIPVQLAKENRKFVYGMLKEGSRAKDYESALSWLSDCGQIHKINRIKKPSVPVKAYEERNSFKLFLVDIGLMSAMVDLDVRTILEENKVFIEFKGALTEQYVLQQLICNDEFHVSYWSAESSTAEVDFIIQVNGLLIPVEVKAEENLQAKSLKVYNEKFSPNICIRTSMSDFRKQDWMLNLPLYAISLLSNILSETLKH